MPPTSKEEARRIAKERAAALTERFREARRKLETGEVDPSFFHPGSLCFVPDADHVWLPAHVVTCGDGVLTASVVSGTEQTVPLNSVRPMEHERRLEDMAEFNYLHDATILHNVRERFKRDEIYTYTGPILVAVNPFRRVDIYGDEVIRRYRGKEASENPPHCYAVADAAYRALCKDGSSQSLIISGESGAGKTVTTKLMLRYLAAVASGDGSSSVQKQILEANPVLEAFGNAKTLRNDNSSRFGKFIEVFFSEGIIVGATITNYLLEKVRLVWQQKGERNYHIFYYLCAGASAEERRELKLRPAQEFHYLNQSGVIAIDDVDDVEEYHVVEKAMEVVGFTADEIRRVKRIVAALLHLGNVEFDPLPNDACEVRAGESLGIVAELLGVDAGTLRSVLCTRRLKTRNEWYTVPLTDAQAAYTRDALAKAVYGRLFDWLVVRINEAIRPSGAHAKGPDGSTTLPFIGVLDIFGFEVFKDNSFEQLCINFANEKLQQLFNLFVFKMELAVYRREEIDTSTVTFADNQDTLDLIEKRPFGLMPMLDEESVVPNGSDEGFIFKAHQKHEKHAKYKKPRINSQRTFIIKHYAGDVQYTVANFLDKNNDKVHIDILKMLADASMDLVSSLFVPAHAEALDADGGGGGGGGGSSSVGGKKVVKRIKTLGLQFREQLADLYSKMAATAPHYIRCIRPNGTQEPGLFVSDPVMHQLRYSGVLESIRVRRCGYPQRADFAEFFRDYRVLAPDVRAPPGTDPSRAARESCAALLRELEMDKAEIQVGKTRVFMRWGTLAILDDRKRYVLGISATVIQKHARRMVYAKRYRAMKVGFLAFHALCRGHIARKRAGPLLAEMRRRQAALRREMAERRRLEALQREAERAEAQRMRREDLYAQRCAAERLRLERAEISAERERMGREDRYARRYAAELAAVDARVRENTRADMAREERYMRRVLAEESRLDAEERARLEALERERRAEHREREAMRAEEEYRLAFLAEERREAIREATRLKREELVREAMERVGMAREEKRVREALAWTMTIVRGYAMRWLTRTKVALHSKRFSGVNEELVRFSRTRRLALARTRGLEFEMMQYEDEIARLASVRDRQRTLRTRLHGLVESTNRRIRGRNDANVVFAHDATGRIVRVETDTTEAASAPRIASAADSFASRKRLGTVEDGEDGDGDGDGDGDSSGFQSDGSYDIIVPGGRGGQRVHHSRRTMTREERQLRILDIVEEAAAHRANIVAREKGGDDPSLVPLVEDFHRVIAAKMPVENEVNSPRRDARFAAVPEELDDSIAELREDLGPPADDAVGGDGGGIGGGDGSEADRAGDRNGGEDAAHAGSPSRKERRSRNRHSRRHQGSLAAGKHDGLSENQHGMVFREPAIPDILHPRKPDSLDNWFPHWSSPRRERARAAIRADLRGKATEVYRRQAAAASEMARLERLERFEAGDPDAVPGGPRGDGTSDADAFRSITSVVDAVRVARDAINRDADARTRGFDSSSPTSSQRVPPSLAAANVDVTVFRNRRAALDPDVKNRLVRGNVSPATGAVASPYTAPTFSTLSGNAAPSGPRMAAASPRGGRGGSHGRGGGSGGSGGRGSSPRSPLHSGGANTAAGAAAGNAGGADAPGSPSIFDVPGRSKDMSESDAAFRTAGDAARAQETDAMRSKVDAHLVRQEDALRDSVIDDAERARGEAMRRVVSRVNARVAEARRVEAQSSFIDGGWNRAVSAGASPVVPGGRLARGAGPDASLHLSLRQRARAGSVSPYGRHRPRGATLSSANPLRVDRKPGRSDAGDKAAEARIAIEAIRKTRGGKRAERSQDLVDRGSPAR